MVEIYFRQLKKQSNVTKNYILAAIDNIKYFMEIKICKNYFRENNFGYKAMEW